MAATIAQIRRENLLELIAKYETIANFNEALGRKRNDPCFSLIKNRQVNRGKPRDMGSKLAREIESRLNLPEGWMDQPHTNDPTEEEGLQYLTPTARLFPVRTIALQGGGLAMAKITVFFDNEVFRSNFPDRDKTDFAAAVVADSSMNPVLCKNDRLLIDTQPAEFTVDGIYLLDTPAGPLLRQVNRRIDGTLVVFSLQDPSDKVELVSDLGIKILGRAAYVWHGSKL